VTPSHFYGHLLAGERDGFLAAARWFVAVASASKLSP